MGCGGSKDAVVTTNKDFVDDSDNNNVNSQNDKIDKSKGIWIIRLIFDNIIS